MISNLGMPKLLLLLGAFCFGEALAQSIGAGTLKGRVTDATNAPMPWADVDLRNSITGYSKQVRTGRDGSFLINNIPPNRYEIRVSFDGFQPYRSEVTIRTAVPLTLTVRLELAGQQQSVTVEGSPEAILETKTA